MSRTIDLTYTSSAGTEFALVTSSRYIKEASIHDYAWTPEVTNFRYGDLVKLFSKEAIKYSITVAYNGSLSDIEDMLTDFHNETEADIMTQTPGTLSYNGYEIECYIIASKVYPGAENTRTLNDLVIYCPYPFWLKETKYSFSMSGSALIDAANFPLNLPLNLGVSGYKKTITVDSSVPYEFRLEIAGAVTNPSLIINGHTYGVSATVPTNATLVISSIERTDIEKCIYISYPSGNTVNVFNKRNKNSYIFEPITGPTIIIASAQELSFDLYLIERRSEPQWT